MKLFIPVLTLALITACGSDSAGNKKQNADKAENAMNDPAVPAQGVAQVSGGVKDEKPQVPSAAEDMLQLMTQLTEKNETVAEESIAGTWIAVWDIVSERTDITTAPRIEQFPVLKVKRTEFVVIRPTAERGQFEMASCNGNGMEAVTLTDKRLSSKSRNLEVESNKIMKMLYSISGQKVVVPRLNKNFDYEPSYIEKRTVSAKYIKIDSSVDSFHQFEQIWGPPSDPLAAVTVTKPLFCAQLDTILGAGGSGDHYGHRLRLGSDDNMKYSVTNSDAFPEEPVAFVYEPDYRGSVNGLIDTSAEQCKASLDVFDNKEGQMTVMANVYADNGSNGVITNQFTINLLE